VNNDCRIPRVKAEEILSVKGLQSLLDHQYLFYYPVGLLAGGLSGLFHNIPSTHTATGPQSTTTRRRGGSRESSSSSSSLSSLGLFENERMKGDSITVSRPLQCHAMKMVLGRHHRPFVVSAGVREPPAPLWVAVGTVIVLVLIMVGVLAIKVYLGHQAEVKRIRADAVDEERERSRASLQEQKKRRRMRSNNNKEGREGEDQTQKGTKEGEEVHRQKD